MGILTTLSISQEEKKEKVMEALTTMLKGCLLHDNHSTCKNVCGQSCHCAIEKEQEELFNQAGGLAEGEGDWNWDELPTALAGQRQYNGYTMDKELEEYFNTMGECECDEDDQGGKGDTTLQELEDDTTQEELNAYEVVEATIHDGTEAKL